MSIESKFPFINLRWPAFEVVINASGSGIANNTYVKVNWNVELYDLGENFSNDKFTAPYGGIYHFNAMLLLSSSTQWNKSEVWHMLLYKNGVAHRVLYRHHVEYESTTDAYYADMLGSVDMKLAAGDYVELYVYQNSGATRYYHSDPAYCHFCGHLVARTS
jgi:hypothetical protein